REQLRAAVRMRPIDVEPEAREIAGQHVESLRVAGLRPDEGRVAAVRRLRSEVAVEVGDRAVVDEIAIVDEAVDLLIEDATRDEARRGEVPLAQQIEVPRALRLEIGIASGEVAEVVLARRADRSGEVWRQVDVVRPRDAARDRDANVAPVVE